MGLIIYALFSQNTYFILFQNERKISWRHRIQWIVFFLLFLILCIVGAVYCTFVWLLLSSFSSSSFWCIIIFFCLNGLYPLVPTKTENEKENPHLLPFSLAKKKLLLYIVVGIVFLCILYLFYSRISLIKTKQRQRLVFFYYNCQQ